MYPNLCHLSIYISLSLNHYLFMRYLLIYQISADDNIGIDPSILSDTLCLSSVFNHQE